MQTKILEKEQKRNGYCKKEYNKAKSKTNGLGNIKCDN